MLPCCFSLRRNISIEEGDFFSTRVTATCLQRITVAARSRCCCSALPVIGRKFLSCPYPFYFPVGILLMCDTARTYSSLVDMLCVAAVSTCESCLRDAELTPVLNNTQRYWSIKSSAQGLVCHSFCISRKSQQWNVLTRLARLHPLMYSSLPLCSWKSHQSGSCFEIALVYALLGFHAVRQKCDGKLQPAGSFHQELRSINVPEIADAFLGYSMSPPIWKTIPVIMCNLDLRRVTFSAVTSSSLSLRFHRRQKSSKNSGIPTGRFRGFQVFSGLVCVAIKF